MRFDPLLPGSWPLVIAVALVMAALLWWSARWAFSALADPGGPPGGAGPAWPSSWC